MKVELDRTLSFVVQIQALLFRQRRHHCLGRAAIEQCPSIRQRTWQQVSL